MLKIKNDVSLRNLEIIGFKHYKNIYIKPIKRNGFIDYTKNVCVDELTREINIQEGLFNVDSELDIIYDLIMLNYVEKQ